MFGGDKLYEIIVTSEFKHATVPRTCRSYLGEQILKEYGNGELLPQPMSRLARAAKRDGLDIQMIETLANLGTDNCHYPDVLLNCARDTGKLLDDCGVADHVTPTDGPHFKWCVPLPPLLAIKAWLSMVALGGGQVHRALQLGLSLADEACAHVGRSVAFSRRAGR